MSGPTIRSLARALRLSPTTVSEALRGLPRVNPVTTRNVQRAARAAGYRYNPLAGGLMSELRRSHGALFRGTIGVVIVDEPERPVQALRFFDELIRGATERSAELGYAVTRFALGGASGVPARRLDSILKSRGVRGLVLLPTWNEPDFAGLDWSHYAGVYTDYIIERPALPTVCSDHHRSLTRALERLYDLGYRRPGILLRSHDDERLHHRWKGAFLAYQLHQPPDRYVPPLVRESFSGPIFDEWYRRWRPDVVLAHDVRVSTWLKPHLTKENSPGFFCLNLNVVAGGGYAGLDQQPALLGARAVELVIAQLQRSEYGLLDTPSLTSIPARFVFHRSLTVSRASDVPRRSG
jgi:DNA-binding LacI/PurR family transcriptional regulator